MKTLFKIFAMAAVAFTVAATTGCDVDADFDDGRKIVIDNIFVEPNGWQTARLADGSFDYYFADIPLPELTDHIFHRGTFETFWRYDEMRDGQSVDVQERLPAVINLDRLENHVWIPYTETVSCSYEVGVMRLMISRSDFNNIRPDKTMYFRTVIDY